MRFKLNIAYDGRPFEGWQSQPSGNTVQDRLQSALRHIAKEPISLHGSGRTDTGVHALGQAAHFDAPEESSMDASAWQRALNANLPPSIRILACAGVPDDFHARYSAVQKTYRYELDTGEVLLPHRAGLAWHYFHPFDRDILHEAVNLYEGIHDFAAFAANRRDDKVIDTVRTVHSAMAVEEGETVCITFTGSGFLYRMVRLLTGSAMRCAGGRETMERLEDLLSSPRGRTSAHCAPGDGLSLISVEYGNGID